MFRFDNKWIQWLSFIEELNDFMNDISHITIK